jgi:hypothetical protein
MPLRNIINRNFLTIATYSGMVSEERPVRGFGGRAKWGEVAGNLGLAALGVGLVAVALAAVPADVVAVRALVAYTVYATVATLVLAVAIATTRRLPVVSSDRLDGEEASVVRTWSGEWWYAVALDLGLAVLAGFLLLLGLAEGGAWAVLGLLVALLGAYFLVRVVLTVTHRRRNEALWVTARELVHDTPGGRARVARAHVVRARRIGDTPHVLLKLDGPVHRTRCPRPWRPRPNRLANEGELVLDTSWVGHDTDTVVDWLRAQLGLGPSALGRAGKVLGTGPMSPGPAGPHR